MFATKEAEILDRFDVKDKVEWRISNDLAASKQGKFRSLGQYIHANDLATREKIYLMERRLEEINVLTSRQDALDYLIEKTDSRVTKSSNQVVKFMDVAEKAEHRIRRIDDQLVETKKLLHELINEH
jgi:hypothetical protein